MAPDRSAPGNRLLAALARNVLERMELEPIELPLGSSVYEPGVEMKHLIFPTAGIVSLIQVLRNGASAEFAMVGNEGVVGFAMFMGGATSPSRAVVQSAGKAQRVRAEALEKEFSRGGELQRVLLRYTHALITQMAQNSVCNRHHSVDQQLCRWLLMSLDRLPSNEVAMTQELIAAMLGVRRETVTEAAGKLEQAGLIRYARGRITVLDRPGLQACACECYGVVKKEYDRLLRGAP